MSDLNRQVPTDSNYITVSMPMNRITIRDATLECLGNPQYISFMMQDDGKAAILRSAEQDEDNAIIVPPSRPLRKFQIGGKLLIGLIRDHMGWNQKLSYRIMAETTQENMLLFDFTKAVPSTSNRYKELLKEDPDELLNADPDEENTDYYWQDTGSPVIKPTDENGEIIVEREVVTAEEHEDDQTELRIEENEWAINQMISWGWNQARIDAWEEEMFTNVRVSSNLFKTWKTGSLTREDFYIHHKELEQMDYAFELGRRISIIRRIRANIKAFNPTMMAILYDERAETCDEILSLIKRNPQLTDFEVAERVKW